MKEAHENNGDDADDGNMRIYDKEGKIFILLLNGWQLEEIVPRLVPKIKLCFSIKLFVTD